MCILYNKNDKHGLYITSLAKGQQPAATKNTSMVFDKRA